MRIITQQAMMYAPQDSEDYALAVANRSAIHFETLNYVACLRDIEEALRSGYPLASKHKLLRRRALCYAHALASLLADDGKAEQMYQHRVGAMGVVGVNGTIIGGGLHQWAPRRARRSRVLSPWCRRRSVCRTRPWSRRARCRSTSRQAPEAT